MENPKKLIRDGQWTEKFDPKELERIEDKTELNRLFVLKVKEELQEIINSDFKDIEEFADLLQACRDFCQNNFYWAEVLDTQNKKIKDRGRFSNLALNNLNPENPSNQIYFK